MFLHTSFANPSSSLVVEIVVTKADGRDFHKVEKASAGFAVLPIFEMSRTAQAVDVQSGSPRMYGSVATGNSTNARFGKTKLRYEFMKNQAFENMRLLVP